MTEPGWDTVGLDAINGSRVAQMCLFAISDIPAQLPTPGDIQESNSTTLVIPLTVVIKGIPSQKKTEVLASEKKTLLYEALSYQTRKLVIFRGFSPYPSAVLSIWSF